jgi:hypothetical protein
MSLPSEPRADKPAPELNGDARQHAARLRSSGFALCKPDPAEKKPTYARWGTYSKEPADFAAGDMIGVIAGPLSEGKRDAHATIIIDLDALEAVDQADEFLPATSMEEGRPSKPRSHRYFLVPLDSIPEWAQSPAEQAAAAAEAETGHPGPFKKAFQRDDGTTAIDFIGTGGQAVCPPSAHPSGERREWTGGAPGEPAVVPFPDLWLAVCRLAEACGCKPPSGLAWPWEERPDPPRNVFTARATGPRASAEERAVRYLERIPGAVSGRGGHRQTFYAARVIVYGFDLGPELGFRILKERFNPLCKPEWTDRELWHKVQDADRLPYHKPRGWLLNAESGNSLPNRGPGTASASDPTTGQTSETPQAEAGAGRPDLWRFRPIDSRQLAEGDFRPRWLVQRLLVADQPGIIGGPVKTLKTSFIIDLAVSLGSATPFLGRFEVNQRRRVAVLSGESGGFTIQETAKRVCHARGIELTDVDCLWEFDLPQLADPGDMTELADGLAAGGVEVLLLDPLYLSLLTAGGYSPDAAKNVYAIGPLLLNISRACLAVKTTPIFAHHANKSIPAGEPMELTHLSGAGVAEFCRQWLLLNRMEKYQGDGSHKLWLSAGGSCGQGGLWAVEVREGELQSDFGGRSWEVAVVDAHKAKSDGAEARGKAKDNAKEAKLKADLNRCEELIAQLCEAKPHVATKNKVRAAGNWSGDRINLLLDRLLIEGHIALKKLPKRKERGGNKRATEGYVRVVKTEEGTLIG